MPTRRRLKPVIPLRPPSPPPENSPTPEQLYLVAVYLLISEHGPELAIGKAVMLLFEAAASVAGKGR